MAAPENPQTIILKNKFYPRGLKEIDVWKYYQSYKGKILNETRGRDIMFAIMTDINKPVIKRKSPSGKFVQLTNATYDKYMTGRTLVVYSTMKDYEDIAIVDIDVDNFTRAKEAAINLHDVMFNAPFVRTAEIRYTGKQSFHIFCKLPRKIKIDSIRFLLEKHIRGTDLLNKYTMLHKRQPGIPNIDLSINKHRGAFITLGSLSLFGLKCTEIPFNRISGFTPSHALIKT